LNHPQATLSEKEQLRLAQVLQENDHLIAELRRIMQNYEVT
jgi:hypothetical protein